MLKKNIQYLILAWLFFLPWQTRLIYWPRFIQGSFWEYGSLSLYGIEIVGWTIVAMAVACYRKKEIIFSWPRAWGIAVGLSLAWLSLGIIWTSDAAATLQFISRFALGVALYMVISTADIPVNRLLGAFWLGGVLQSLFGLSQFFSQSIVGNKWLGLASHHAADLGAAVIETGGERWLRAYGSFGWPNSLGIYLGVALVAGYILCLKQKGPIWRLPFIAGQLILSAGLLLTFSRSAIVAAALGIFAVTGIVLQNKWRAVDRQEFWRSAQDVIWHGAYCAFIAGVLVVLLWPLFHTRLSATERLEQRSLLERRHQAEQAVAVVGSHWLTGVGAGAYTAFLHQYLPEAPAWHLQPVHNIYLLALAELGVIGMIVISIVFWQLCKFGGLSPNEAVALLLTLAAAGFFDHWSWTLFTGQITWWVIMGLAQSSVLIRKNTTIQKSA